MKLSPFPNCISIAFSLCFSAVALAADIFQESFKGHVDKPPLTHTWGGIATQLGRPLKWNPQQEQFVNDPQANRLLSVAMREPWHS